MLLLGLLHMLVLVLDGGCGGGGSDLHNRIIASAMRIIRKWWYPMNGMKREMPTAKRTFAMADFYSVWYSRCGVCE